MFYIFVHLAWVHLSKQPFLTPSQTLGRLYLLSKDDEGVQAVLQVDFIREGLIYISPSRIKSTNDIPSSTIRPNKNKYIYWFLFGPMMELEVNVEEVPLVEFMYPLFTCMPGELP